MIIAERLVLEPFGLGEMLEDWPPEVSVPDSAGWAIMLAAEARMVGFVTWDRGLLDGLVFEADRGRGFGREAARAVVEYLVVVERVSRLEVRTSAESLAAGKILLGLSFEPSRDGDSYLWVLTV